MDKIIKKILEAIEDEGYEAYLVGGYVRDFFLGKSSYDIVSFPNTVAFIHSSLCASYVINWPSARDVNVTSESPPRVEELAPEPAT